MPRTTSPLLSRADREVIHDIQSSRALILRRLAMRDDAWLDRDRVIPDGPPVTEFGRALDREPIQDAPIGPERVPFWRVVAVIAACWLIVACALVGAGVLARGALRLFGVL